MKRQLFKKAFSKVYVGEVSTPLARAQGYQQAHVADGESEVSKGLISLTELH